MPEEDKIRNDSGFNKTGTGEFDSGDEWKEPAWKEKPVYDAEKSKMLIGGALVLIGIAFLVKQFINFSWNYLWPVLLVGLGVALLYRGRRN
jgi:F0F1-type ATP synthase assembly protein I